MIKYLSMVDSKLSSNTVHLSIAGETDSTMITWADLKPSLSLSSSSMSFLMEIWSRISSKAEETSVENSGLRQGIFSHFLLKALEGKADDNEDSMVTLDEAFKYVRENVNYYTSKYQTPVMVGNIENLVMSELR